MDIKKVIDDIKDLHEENKKKVPSLGLVIYNIEGIPLSDLRSYAQTHGLSLKYEEFWQMFKTYASLSPEISIALCSRQVKVIQPEPIYQEA